MRNASDIPEETFRELVGRAWDEVPEKFSAKLDNVVLLVEDEPSPEVRRQEKLAPRQTLFGLYHGIPESDRGASYGIGVALPDTVTLYRLPILEEAVELTRECMFPSFEAAVEEAIRETLWHELGHYFGLHEREIRIRERGGTNQYRK